MNPGFPPWLGQTDTRAQPQQWKSDQGDPALLSQVQGDEQAAAAQSLSGTPTLIMSGKKGAETVQGSGGALPNYGNLAAAVQAVQ